MHKSLASSAAVYTGIAPVHVPPSPYCGSAGGGSEIVGIPTG